MDHYEQNCHMIRLLFGSYISEINQHIPLQHYGILLPEQSKYSLSSFFNIYTDDLKQTPLTCSLIVIQRNTVKLVLNKNGHGGSYNWPIFMIENDLENNYVDKYSLSQFDHCQRNIYVIGIGTTRDNIINPSSQFIKYSYPRKSRSLTNYLKKN